MASGTNSISSLPPRPQARRIYFEQITHREPVLYGSKSLVWTDTPAMLWPFAGNKLPRGPEDISGIRTLEYFRQRGEWVYIWFEGKWILGRAELPEQEAIRHYSELLLLRSAIGNLAIAAGVSNMIPGHTGSQVLLAELIQLARSFERGWNKLVNSIITRYLHSDRYYGLVFSAGESFLARLTDSFRVREDCIRELFAEHSKGNLSTLLLHVNPKGRLDLAMIQPLEMDTAK